jgi:hypothetical protein
MDFNCEIILSMSIPLGMGIPNEPATIYKQNKTQSNEQTDQDNPPLGISI